MKLLHSFEMIAFLLFASGITVNAQKVDEEAIKQVLQQETNAYFKANYTAWANTWAHDSADYMLRLGTNSFNELEGWNAISKVYKQSMKNMTPYDDAAMATFQHKFDYHFYINGNVASVSFKEGDKNPNSETRTLVKQNGGWKILNYVLVNKSSYDMENVMDYMKSMSGKWELDGKDTTQPSNGFDAQMIRFDLKSTPNGMEQTSSFRYTYKNQLYAPPADIEYFIPDYRTMNVTYLVIQKNNAGLTATRTGTVTSEHPNSFTVTVMNPDKPDIKIEEYTVSLQNGKWHQVSKNYDGKGKVVSTSTVNLRRM